MQEAATPGDKTRVPPDPYDDGINLMEYGFVLWRHKWIVAGVALFCGLAALGLGLTSSPTYEATVKLMVSQPKTMGAGETTPMVSVATFRALIENQSLAARVIQEFKLGDAPLRMTPGRFLRGNLTVEAVRDTSVVVLRVRMPSAQLASKVANRMAELAVELSQTLSQNETVRTRDYIKAQLDQSQTRFDGARVRLEAFQKQAQIEALRKDVDTALGQRAGLLPLLVEIQAEKARLAQAEALLGLRNRIDTDTERAKLTEAESQLGKRKRVDTLSRSIETDNAAMEAARRTAPAGSEVLGLQLKSEYVNPVYESLDQVAATSRTRLAELEKQKQENLDQQVAASRTRLSGLEKQKAELIDVRKLDSSQLALLNTLYTRESELAHLQTEFDLAKSVYVDVSTRYEQARLQVAGKTAQLQVMDSALPPDRPIGPKVVRNTAIAILVGLMLGAIAALFFSALAAASGRQTTT